MESNKCTRAHLVACIEAYAVASKTDNPILKGLVGDYLNKLLETVSFAEDERAQAAIEAATEPTVKKPRPRKFS